MSTVLTLYRASLKEFVRDRAALFWTLAFPLLFIVLFGVIFSGNGSPNYTVGLVNQDTGQVGTALTQAFDGVKAFDVKKGTLDNELNNLKTGQLDMVLVVPPSLSDAVAASQVASVKMYYDPSKNQTKDRKS